MNREAEIAELERKIREERSKAENAPDPAGYRSHTDQARAYERQLRMLYRGA